MNHPLFPTRFAGGALVFGAVLALLGFFVRPVANDKSFTVDDILAIETASGVWVMSFRMLVFGLFVRLAGLVSLATFARAAGARAVVVPGVAISAAGLLVSAMVQGYYMDIALHGAWRFAQESSAQGREAILASWLPVDEWVSCLGRMGLMFLGLGSVVLGLGLRAEVPAVVGWGLVAVGFAGMMGIFALPGSADVQTASFVGLALAHGLLGTVLAMQQMDSARNASPA